MVRNLNDLRESIGKDPVHDAMEYPLPRPHKDSLDSDENLRKYMMSKIVLEDPEVNVVLAHMDAFDVLNEYDIESYYTMACDVANAIKVHYEENKETPQEYTLKKDIILGEASGYELNEFSEEFLIEFSKHRFMSPTPSENSIEGDDSELAAPPQADGWLKKLGAKFGLSDISFKDLLYLYFINQYGHKGEGPPVKESFQALLNEKAPPGMEGWIKSRKEAFKKKYGEGWEQVLYSTAWRIYKEGGLDESNDGQNTPDNELMTETMEMNEGTDDVFGGANKVDDKTSPKMSSQIKSDVNKRLKELEELISSYEEKKHFYGDVKPAVFNAKDSLNFIMDKCKSGKMSDYKEAQMHFQKVMSPIANLFPPSLIKFLSYGGDSSDNSKLKEV